MDKNLNEQIKEFKSPQSKVLVTALFLAVIALYSKSLYNESETKKKCTNDAEKYERKIDVRDSIINSMKIEEVRKSYEERRDFKVLIAQQDSTIDRLQKALNDLKR